MRYVTIPAPIQLEHPETGQPLMQQARATADRKPNLERATMEWSQFARSIFLHPDLSTLDILVVSDLRARILDRTAGMVVDLDDQSWGILCRLARSCAGMAPGFALQAVPFVRAIVEAPTAPPTLAHAGASVTVSKKRKRAP